MNLQTTISLYANRKLHKRLKFQGLDISIENRAGSTRRGTAPGWGPWETHMKFDYGYIKGSKGMDGGGIDCFIGPNPKAKNAYVVHILKQPKFKSYDEDKVMLGFNSKKEAKNAFSAHYDSPKFYGGMDVLRMDEFKRKALETATTGPHKIEAWGEPQVYDGGYQHIADTQIMYRPPSDKKGKPIPVDDPMEKDNRFLDVTKRKERATKAFRDNLTRQHTDQNMKPLNRQLVSGFPAVGIGGFG